MFTFCSSLSMFGCFDRCPLPGNAPLRHTWPNALKLQQSIGVTWNVFKGAGHRVVATCRVVANVFSCVCLGSVRVCGHVMTCCHAAEELIKLCVCACFRRLAKDATSLGFLAASVTPDSRGHLPSQRNCL